MPPRSFTVDFRRRLRNLDTADEVSSGFDLSNYMLFELVRGSENSSNPELLDFFVYVDYIEDDRFYFKIKFENPTAVS